MTLTNSCYNQEDEKTFFFAFDRSLTEWYMDVHLQLLSTQNGKKEGREDIEKAIHHQKMPVCSAQKETSFE